jgi:hypothetical protein
MDFVQQFAHFSGPDKFVSLMMPGWGRGAEAMDEIEILDYDPRWPSLFDEEAKRLPSPS